MRVCFGVVSNVVSRSAFSADHATVKISNYISSVVAERGCVLCDQPCSSVVSILGCRRSVVFVVKFLWVGVVVVLSPFEVSRRADCGFGRFKISVVAVVATFVVVGVVVEPSCLSSSLFSS